MRTELQNLFGRTFYVIEHKEDLDFVDTVWFGYASQNDLRKACEVGLQVQEQARCAYKLNDNSAFTGPWSESVAWLEKEWLPRAIKAGLRYLAHVAHKHSYGETAGEVMQISKIGQMLEVCVFTSREEAVAWLQSCQRKNADVSVSPFS